MDDGLKSLPFPAAYWVIPGRLLAGQFPGDRCITTATDKLTGLLNCGVRRVVNLMEADETNHQGELFRPYEGELSDLATARNQFVTFVRYPIPDMGVPSQQQMRLILDDLDRSLAQGDVVYVHCWGGVGRTGTVVGLFFGTPWAG
jgi:protein tyrosine phosphatase